MNESKDRTYYYYNSGDAEKQLEKKTDLTIPAPFTEDGLIGGI